MPKQSIVIITLCAFFSSFFPSVQAQELVLPMPLKTVALSPMVNLPILKGVKVHANQPFKLEFILDKGVVGSQSYSGLEGAELKNETAKLIKYFLASLTIPEKDLWVNLSPYEKDKVIPDTFGQTQMGQDLLAQDYVLKQITASLMNPDGEIGKEFWKKIYQDAMRRYGNVNVPINTFNKVWIVPDQASVYEQGSVAYVLKSHLRVMLEEDYVAFNKFKERATLPKTSTQGQQNQHPGKLTEVSSQIIREIILPALENEVNEGKDFLPLRQISHALILATWFKKRLRQSLLGKVYVDQGKTGGVDRDTDKKKKTYKKKQKE